MDSVQKKAPYRYVTLFVAYFNFLRPHASLEGKVPVVIQNY